MPSLRLEDLSPFGRAALLLDQEFSDLARIADQLSTAKIDSDSGLDEAVKLLTRAAQHGETLSSAMQEFSTTLQEARDKAESSAKLVSERAQGIQQRRQEQENLQEKMTRLKDDVKTLGTTVAGSNSPANTAPTDEDKGRIAQELERLQEPMQRFIEAAQKVKEEASGKNFKRIERQADSMIDSLQSSRRKIQQAIAPK